VKAIGDFAVEADVEAEDGKEDEDEEDEDEEDEEDEDDSAAAAGAALRAAAAALRFFDDIALGLRRAASYSSRGQSGQSAQTGRGRACARTVAE